MTTGRKSTAKLPTATNPPLANKQDRNSHPSSPRSDTPPGKMPRLAPRTSQVSNPAPSGRMPRPMQGTERVFIENDPQTEYSPTVVSRDEKKTPSKRQPGTLRAQFHVPAGGVPEPVAQAKALLEAHGIAVDVVEHMDEHDEPRSNRSRAGEINSRKRALITKSGGRPRHATTELEERARRIGDTPIIDLLESVAPDLAASVRARTALKVREHRSHKPK